VRKSTAGIEEAGSKRHGGTNVVSTTAWVVEVTFVDECRLDVA
jgi:hypothetical protein